MDYLQRNYVKIKIIIFISSCSFFSQCNRPAASRNHHLQLGFRTFDEVTLQFAPIHLRELPSPFPTWFPFYGRAISSPNANSANSAKMNPLLRKAINSFGAFSQPVRASKTGATIISEWRPAAFYFGGAHPEWTLPSGGCPFN